MNQKFSYFPRPSIRATTIHSRHLYFPPVSTFGLPEHEFSYSLNVQCILNLATYFIFSLHRPFFYYSLCKLTCKFILFIFMKIGSTNKYETLNETIKKICVKFKIIFCRYIDSARISELNGISHHALLLKNHCILVCQKYYPTEKIGPKMPYFDSQNDGIKFLCNNQLFFNWKITVMKPTPK